MNGGTTTYAAAIRLAFEHLLATYPEVFVIGQGLWSPWYVGSSMMDLDKKFGVERVIDTPVSELACTGAAIGASLAGMRAVVVHPRVDFMLYAMDAVVNQAAKWSHMTGGQGHPAVTIRAIVNRGGEQGAQHSQALHAWFAHVPGLRVVVPATVADARDLLVASVLCDDPVLYMDDRWLYEREANLGPIAAPKLATIGPQLLRSGQHLTLVGCGYSTYLCEQAAAVLAGEGIEAEVIDLRVLNPLDARIIIESVKKTRRLCAVDGGWRTAGIAGEVLARVVEAVPPNTFAATPVRVTLPDAPAPSSRVLEKLYYPGVADVLAVARRQLTLEPL